MEALAFINPAGSVHVDTNLTTEEDVWQIFLGWPSQEEIEWHKKNGCRVVKVKIEIIEEDVK